MSIEREPQTAVPLSPAAQRANIAVFAGCTALVYLGAPALYVGALHAGIGNWLNVGTTNANIPGSIVFFMTFVPVLLAWRSPGVNVLRRNMILSYVAMTLVLALNAATIYLPIPPLAKFSFVVLQAAVCGAASPTAMALLWEMIGRGVDESRRGLTLALGFGLGPLSAVTGSYLQTWLVGGEILQFRYDAIGATFAAINEPGAFDWSRLDELIFAKATFPGFPAPDGYACLFGIGAGCMALAALLTSLAVIPRESSAPRLAEDVSEEDGAAPDLAALFGNFIRSRTLALAGLATILLYTGNLIVSNLTLYSQFALDVDPEHYAGPFNMLRFGAKFVAGVGLGWLLSKTNPRAGMLVTGALYLLSLCVAIGVTGPGYKISAALFGAGELVGVYAPNYILSASKKSNLRGNMALIQLVMMPTSVFGILFGAVAEGVGSFYHDEYGEATAKAMGFRASFVACGLIVLAGLAVVFFLLPAKPRPSEEAAGEAP